MTEQARVALTEAEKQAKQAECIERIEAGDKMAVYEYFDLSGIDLRPQPGDEIIRRPST